MATIRGYIGASLDYYIAGPDGDLDWLTPYEKADFGGHGYPKFIADIRTVVMGRTTYDWLVAAGAAWPYADKRAIVVTSRPIDKPAGALREWDKGIEALVTYLRPLDDGDVWLAGGGKLQQAMIAAGGLDRLELFVVPEILGAGVPLFPANGFRRPVRLSSATALGSGIVRLDYDFTAG